MHWLQQLGSSPMLAVNLGTGTPPTPLPSSNTATSPPAPTGPTAAPYAVPLWCLGNEMDGDWQAGHVPADVYAQSANQESRLMKGLDLSIETVVCGSSGYL